jgi:hypothetical protein
MHLDHSRDISEAAGTAVKVTAHLISINRYRF